MRILTVLAAAVLWAAAPYSAEIAAWRAAHDAELGAPNGWLSVAGLFWLHEGENAAGSDPLSDIVMPARAPRNAGVFRFSGGTVTFVPASGAARRMKPDNPGPADVLEIDGVVMTVIVRGGRTGVRLRDPQSKARAEFRGSRWFPADEKWKVRAKWVAWPEPRTIPITNVLGMTMQEPTPGYAEFELGGRKMRLEPVTEDDHLFFLFKDQTSGQTTYGAGRFLYAAVARDGFVELDFNKAENPPCAFTAFATCPLPPRQNTLPVAVEAGEMKYDRH